MLSATRRETVVVRGGRRGRVEPNHRITTRSRLWFGGGVLLAVSAASATPTVTTDLPNYLPGNTAYITGAGFHAMEEITLQVVHADGTPMGGAGHEPGERGEDGLHGGLASPEP